MSDARRLFLAIVLVIAGAAVGVTQEGSTPAAQASGGEALQAVPIADAGLDIASAVGKAVTLNGSASSDPDGDTLTYQWTVVDAPPGSARTLTTPNKSKAKLFIDRAGAYVVQLTVKDGASTSAPDEVVITTTNTAPISRAGPDRVVTSGVATQLDGTASSDIDGQPLSFLWKLKRPAGSGATLSDTTSARPAFVPDVAGNYTATLTVSDGVLSKSDAVTLTTNGNLAPVARAGLAHPALVAGQTIVLDGSESTDANGDRLTYAWTIAKRPGASTASLGSPAAVRSTFTADVKGNYTFALVVTDGLGASSSAQAVYSAALAVADAGRDQSVAAGQVVQLDGTASSHFNGTLAYGWALVSIPAGSAAVLSAPANPQPLFTADVAGTYVAQLIVFDGVKLSPADTAVVTVGDNTAPYVDLGPDQVVPVATIVTLDSDAVVDPDPGALTLRWALLARPAASAAALTSASGSSTQLAVDVAGAYVVQLSAVDNDGLSATDIVVITTAKGRPTVTAGPDLAGSVGVAVALGATASDPDGGGVAYGWQLLSRPAGSTAGLAGPPNAPSLTPDLPGVYVAQVLVVDADGLEALDAVAVRVVGGPPPVVTVAATDATASEAPDPGTFTFTRTGNTAAALNGVAYTRSGTATGSDYTPSLPASGTVDFAAGQATTTVTITPVADGVVEGAETVILTLVDGAEYDLGAPATRTATVTIAADTGTTNGAMLTGSIVAPGEVDTYTFTATAGTRIAVHVGEITESSDFWPWARLTSPSGASLGNTSNSSAVTIEAVAPETGTYTVLIASNDSGRDGAATYRLTTVRTPGPYMVSPGDQGGGLVNGSVHSGELVRGDVDVWTFSATAGDRLAVHLAEVVDNNDLWPWVRLWSPTGASVAASWNSKAAAIEVVAPTTGVYTVLVSSADTGTDATGTYRLEMARTPGSYTISAGDQGGALVNGSVHTGTIVQGDVDVWTFSATAGDRLAVHLGEVVDNDDLWPWVRLWSPTGGSVAASWNSKAVAVEAVAPVTGVYTVLVSSADTGVDGTGTYRLEMARAPGPYTTSAGDQGAALVNGSVHTGAIVQGDVDVWTFSATAGDRLAVHLAEVVDNDDLWPWVRLWSPTGGSVAASWNSKAVAVEAVAPVTGVYTVLVSSADTGVDGTGTYRLEMARAPGPYTTSAGDQGAALVNGSVYSGTMEQGDVDVWTFSATAGDRLAVHLAEVVDNDDFWPWVRLWSPTGGSVAASWNSRAAAVDAVAPVTGVYTVVVSSADTGLDGTGTYRLEMVKTPAPVSISAGDDGGSISSGALRNGTIVKGDVDAWTISAVAGQHITVTSTQTSETDDFWPWVRLWSPTGTVVGQNWGAAGASINSVVAPVTGTYIVVVGSADTGLDGSGTYSLQVTVGP